MSLTAVRPDDYVDEPRENYLNAGHSIRSWLFTLDHKRIGILYLLSISFFFAIGGISAALVRTELVSPRGLMMNHEQYNRAFTTHGVMMVFFFLVPSIPAVFGNFALPLMIGAKDVAFPRLNLLSWYLFITGASCAFIA